MSASSASWTRHSPWCRPPTTSSACTRSCRAARRRYSRHATTDRCRSSPKRTFSSSSLTSEDVRKRVRSENVKTAPHKHGFETIAIHAGQDPEGLTGAVVVPIFQTSTFAQEAVGKNKGYEYARTGNPTRTALETCLAALEGARWGLAFASGMAASDAVAHLLSKGDHVVMADDVYGGTYRLFARVFDRAGIDLTAVDMRKLDAVRRAMRARTKLVWIETPSNPLMKVLDIAALAEIAHKGKALAVADNTFASPYLQRPIKLGADLVLHSTTKYLGGHSDVVGGALAGNDAELRDRLAFVQNAAGGVPGPFDAWLVLRGAKTLGVRMDRHSANAQAIAEWLAGDPQGTRGHYPRPPPPPPHPPPPPPMRAVRGGVSLPPRGGGAGGQRVAARGENV